MKLIYGLLTSLALTLTSFSANHVQGDSGTLRMTWNEFRNMSRDSDGITLKNGFNNTDKDSDWTKIEIRFDMHNKGSRRKKIRCLISIFDKSQNLIFTGSSDNSIGKMKSEEMKCTAKISSETSFDPEIVYLRYWWIVE